MSVYRSSSKTIGVMDGEDVDISSTDHTFSQSTRSIWVGTGGTLIFTTVEGTELTFTNVPDGTMVPAFATAVTRTGTTASDMVGCW